MQVTVFGANGKVGTILTEELLRKGFKVNAFIHGEFRVPAQANLVVVQGDISEPLKIKTALKRSDAVISTLGSWGTPKKNILYTGMQHIIPAMKELGMRRIITLTGADARDENDPKGLVHRLNYPLLNLLAGKILKDGEIHIALLRRSGLDWTTLRSPVMNEKGRATYSLSSHRPMPWKTIHRHAVVQALIEQLEDTKHFQSSPFLARK